MESINFKDRVIANILFVSILLGVASFSINEAKILPSEIKLEELENENMEKDKENLRKSQILSRKRIRQPQKEIKEESCDI